MREIKFRLWDKTQNEIIPHEDIMFDYIFDNINLLGESFELMQFTGLKDKNGVELYEDYIVRYKDEIDDSTPHKLVTMEIGMNGTDFLEYLSWNEFEVIGNIYENPDLL